MQIQISYVNTCEHESTHDEVEVFEYMDFSGYQQKETIVQVCDKCNETMEPYDPYEDGCND